MMGYFHVHYYMTIPKWAQSSLRSHFLSRYGLSKLMRFPHFSAFWPICIEISIFQKNNDFKPMSGQMFPKMATNIHPRNIYVTQDINFRFQKFQVIFWLLLAKMSQNFVHGIIISGQIGKLSLIYSILCVYNAIWASLLILHQSFLLGSPI